jgi:hypothetical protein
MANGGCVQRKELEGSCRNIGRRIGQTSGEVIIVATAVKSLWMRRPQLEAQARSE